MSSIPYTRHHITPEDEAAVLRALRSGYLTQGPETEALEAELAAEVGTRYAVALSSCTAALWCACRTVIDQRVWHLPAITFVASKNACTDPTPWITEVDPDTGLMVPHTVAGADNLMVQCHGGAIPDPAQYTAGGGLVLDAAHAMGRGLLAWANAGATICLSFHAAKQVAGGEGGAVCTNDPSIADIVRRLRNHGRIAREAPLGRGLNLRITEMSAALVRSQLTRLAQTHLQRRVRWAHYQWAFGTAMVNPAVPYHAYHLAQILVDNAPELRAALGTPLHYPPLADLPGARAFAERAVTLPLYPTMTEEEQDQVIATVRRLCPPLS